ncbi:hypothetical protein ACFFOS_28025 [Nocardioides kongjuensis]|uniref:Uncharacterized protein n=1 Tax=Nocardioides kongjuensis TaxID=349522 RepID=A0A852RCD2_9ACTN|nr:hypothetical protein [Nocardioides kongjuensis]NYD31241.1 hypothetical protein [Nocardioides kongjuensis]
MATTTHVEKVVNQIEAEIAEDAAKRRAEASALREELAQAKAVLKETEGAPERVLKAVRNGSDVEPGALIEAEASLKVAKARVEGLAHRLEVASKSMLPAAADAAALLIPTFQRRLVGVPIMATVIPSNRVIAEVKGSEGPAVVLCQESDTRYGGDGMVSAPKVVAVFVRPSWAADLPVMDIEAEARRDTIAMTVNSNYEVNGYQTLGITIQSGAEEVPLIREVGSMGVNGAVQTFGSQVMHALGEYPQLPTIRNGVYSYQGAYGRMDLAKIHVAEEVAKDGTRTTHLSLECHIFVGGRDRDYVRNAPRLVIAQGFASGMGRLKAIKVQDSGNADPRAATVSQDVTLEYVSRVK